MMKAVLLVPTILIGMSLLVEGDDTCVIKGKAKLNSFGSSNLNLKMPCKFHATSFLCDGFKINVSPGLAFDENARYFTDTVLVGITRHKTQYYWRGRITNNRMMKYFRKEKAEPFNTDEENRNFDVEQSGVNDTKTVTLKVGKLTIVYTGYHPKSKTLRKNNGLKITCAAKAEYLEKNGLFPRSLCGNKSDVLTARRRELGFGTRTRTVMYDVLDNDDVQQNNPECELAVNVFKFCDNEIKIEAVKDCSHIVGKSSVIKCQNKHNYDPMHTFRHCLNFKCKKNDYNSCNSLKVVEDDCPRIAVLKGNGCPKQGPDSD